MRLFSLKHNQDAAGGAPAPAPPPAGGASAPVSPTPGGVAPPAGSPAAAPAAPPTAGAAAPPEPEPKAWTPPTLNNPAANRSTISSMFGSPINEPAPPKEYTPESFQRYQAELSQAQAAREFRRDLEETIAAPIVYGDGVHLVLNSPEEVNGFARFVSDVVTGKQRITAADLALLYKRNDVLAMAREQGQREFHNTIKTHRASSKITPGQPVVPAAPAVDNAPKNPNSGRIPSVGDIWKQHNPQGYADFMAGKTRLT